ncbi:hypothetical protein ULMS_28450 [Patiriisocius marinistellae]|uniref:Secretion system C-terminal sorting domain-containing protein n=1 Tax=Patiriisocius marinistellae TaxID=2494560 RepID=A0A5J4FX52_9FLAO|nr:T9SS type A sorting domain-containing protein [Patiriisocius marinistellae]GEQ87337.1 hypothetical protein ULMS_28450 [Patiriisocius marinistellae]
MKTYTFLFFVLIAFQVNSQITLIPDTNFENELIEQGIDTDNTINGQVATADIENLTMLMVNDEGIQDLTGIQDFISLEMLSCNLNELTSIDVSNLINLTFLGVGVTNITTIDVSSNVNLESFFCAYNNLTSIDVSNNPALEVLFVGQSEGVITPRNRITDLDLSNNPNLDRLQALNLDLEHLNLMNGNNSILDNVETEGNPLLQCILVDNPIAANNGEPPYSTWEIDPTTSYANGPNCTLGIVGNEIEVLSVFPNPTQEYIMFDLGYERAQKIEIYNTLGNLVKVYKKGVSNILPVKELSNGMYILKIQTETKLYSAKFLKE